MGSSALLLALATPVPDTAPAPLIAISPAIDPFIASAALRPPGAEDPFLTGIALRRPIVVFDTPARPKVVGGPPPVEPRHSPRLDPALRDDAPRTFARLHLPTLDETLPQPARRGGGGALSGRVVVRLAPDGDRVGMTGGVVGALWKLIPELD